MATGNRKRRTRGRPIKRRPPRPPPPRPPPTPRPRPATAGRSRETSGPPDDEARGAGLAGDPVGDGLRLRGRPLAALEDEGANGEGRAPEGRGEGRPQGGRGLRVRGRERRGEGEGSGDARCVREGQGEPAAEPVPAHDEGQRAPAGGALRHEAASVVEGLGAEPPALRPGRAAPTRSPRAAPPRPRGSRRPSRRRGCPRRRAGRRGARGAPPTARGAGRAGAASHPSQRSCTRLAICPDRSRCPLHHPGERSDLSTSSLTRARPVGGYTRPERHQSPIVRLGRSRGLANDRVIARSRRRSGRGRR